MKYEDRIDKAANIILTIILITIIVLKIVGVIAWPWIWILNPIWILFGLGTIFAIIITIACIISELTYKRRRKK